MQWRPKFSLATLIVFVLATGVFTWMNVTPHGKWSFFVCEGTPEYVKWYGWPLVACEWVDTETRQKIMAEKPVIFIHDYPIWSRACIIIDVIFFFVVVFLASYLTERFVRSRSVVSGPPSSPNSSPPTDP
jgi:hypothetical protein